MENLLYLVHRIPYPPNKGDKIRSYHLLRFLSKRYRVHLGTFIDDEADWDHVGAVKGLCGETHFARLDPRKAKLRSLSGLLAGRALTLPYYSDAGLQAWVDALVRQESIKRVFVFSSAMAQYVEKLDARRVIDFCDIDSDKWTQYAATKPWPLNWIYRREGRLLLDYERRIAASFDASVFVSAAEAAMFRKLAPESAKRVGHFNNGVDATYFSPDRRYSCPYPSGERVIVFTGAMDYWPNVDAVTWFSREVFPGIRARSPEARFYIVGARPTPAVQELERIAGVRVTGPVPDVRPYLAHALLAVAPLRIARGVQNKVLEAMAMARPVIVSPEALEGIEARVNDEIYLARDPGEWVNYAADILESATGFLGAAARRRVVASYGWEGNLAVVDALLQAHPPDATLPLGTSMSRGDLARLGGGGA